VQNSLNQMLEFDGKRPVKIRAGADFGRLDFVRVGSEIASEVNIVGFAANFASKCEKAAGSWEVVIGEGLAQLLPEWQYRHHEDSPKPYQRDGEVRRYKFYWADWRPYLEHLDEIEKLERKPLSSIHY
jgi:class 3 adenylate cyclase